MGTESIDGSTRLYADVGSLVNKKILTVLPLLLILALPSAFAESFVVTTNKDIYASDEKAIILGAIPPEAPDGFAVLLKITGPEGDCARPIARLHRRIGLGYAL